MIVLQVLLQFLKLNKIDEFFLHIIKINFKINSLNNVYSCHSAYTRFNAQTKIPKRTPRMLYNISSLTQFC